MAFRNYIYLNNYNLRKKVSNNENENNIPLINKYLNVENNNKNFLLDDKFDINR